MVLALVVAAAILLGGKIAPQPTTADGSPSDAVAERLAAELGSDPEAQAVYLIRGGGDAADFERSLEGPIADLRADDRVASAIRVVDTPVEGAAALLVRFGDLTPTEAQDATSELASRLGESNPDLRIRVAGPVADRAAAERLTRRDLGLTALIAVPLLVLLLIATATGSPLSSVAMLGTAAFALAGTVCVLGAAGGADALGAATLAPAAAVALVLGVEFPRIFLSSYRSLAELLGAGTDAVKVATVDAGRTVAGSALAVLAVCAAALLVPVAEVREAAGAVALAAALAGVSTLVLMPALLGLSGPSLLRVGARMVPAVGRTGAWLAAGVGTLVLIVLCVLAFDVSLRSFGGDLLPGDAPERSAAQELDDSVGLGYDGPVEALVSPAERASDLSARWDLEPGVAGVSEPVGIGDDRSLVLVRLAPEPGSVAGRELVARLQTIAGDEGIGAQLGGAPGRGRDLQSQISDRAPLVLALGTILLAAALVGFGGSPWPLSAALGAGLGLAALAVVLGALGATGLLLDAATIFPGVGSDRPDALTASAVAVALLAVAAIAAARSGGFAIAAAEERRSGATGAEALDGAAGRLQAAHITGTVAAMGILGVLAFVARVPSVQEFALLAVAGVVLDGLLVRVTLVPALAGLLGRSGAQ